MNKLLIFTNFFCLFLISQVSGHGRLLNPPSRSSAWREMPGKFPAYYNDNEMFCGGEQVQWVQNGGKCGICGENWALPKQFEKGGQLYRGISTRTYKQGQTIDVYVEITANHVGWFEFRICNTDNLGGSDATQDCLNRTVLKNENGITRMPIPSSMRDFRERLVLPAGLTCNKCVLQWKYITANSWGVDPVTGRGCLGCGPTQEQFYGCSDVTITSNGQSVPEERYENTRRSQSSTKLPTRHRTISSSVQTQRQPGSLSTRKQSGSLSTQKQSGSSSTQRCPNGDGSFADTSNGCRSFYVCVYSGSNHEQRHTLNCPPGTLFDNNKKVCDHAQSVRC